MLDSASSITATASRINSSEVMTDGRKRRTAVTKGGGGGGSS